MAMYWGLVVVLFNFYHQQNYINELVGKKSLAHANAE